MRIEAYEFGRIRVDGREFSRDVVVLPDRVDAPWWRQKGHSLGAVDLSAVLASPPQVLVIGTGLLGRMAVPKETQATLEEAGIEVHAVPTTQAVGLFNRLEAAGKRPVGAFHLTC